MDRAEVAESAKWNVEVFYPSLENWKKEFTKCRFEELKKFRGRLHEGPKTIRAALEALLGMERELTKLYTYAHLRHDEDVGNDAYKEAYLRAVGAVQQFKQESAWIEPELLEVGDLNKFIVDPELAPYQFYLEKIVRMKPHTLDAGKEALLAGASLALDASERAFGAFNNADLRFPQIADGQGKMHSLTHGKYPVYMRSFDREMRKNAFTAYHGAFNAYENTLCELIQGEMQKHAFLAKTRGFASCLEAALFPHNIDKEVYLNLIATVRKHLPVLHEYMAFRKEALKVDELHLYDLSVPLMGDVEIKMDFEAACRFIVESVSMLGAHYQQDLERGLFQDRWVDRYENSRKRSGAYSSGCYDSRPYILMNYQDDFNSIMTLSHEAGHSMHSHLAWKTQKFHDASYPIFVAEIASTFHEDLTMRHFLKTVDDPLKRAYLINQQIEGIRNTFFRQVMFAEFELKLHELVEQGTPLTPALLKKEYLQLVSDYFGPHVTIDPFIAIEWARIPHFYYNFYVYQYATGIAAAHALVELVLKEGSSKYLKFLSSGGSRFPLELLRTAGIDMRNPKVIEMAMNQFAALTRELKKTVMADVVRN
jgi:oligoendopeptidase F